MKIDCYGKCETEQHRKTNEQILREKKNMRSLARVWLLFQQKKRFAARTHNLSTFLCNLRLVAFHLTTAYYFILSLYGLISVVSSFFRLQFNIETYVSVLIAFLPFGLVLRR